MDKQATDDMAIMDEASLVAAYQRTVELTKRAFDDPDGPIPDDVPEDLVKAVLAARDP